MQRGLKYYGDPVLREAARPVRAFDESLRRLAGEMLALMREQRGVGLAAQQIGETLSICVLDVPDETGPDGAPRNPDAAMPLVLVNPRIAEGFGPAESMEEGCLSFPEINAPIERPGEVLVEFQDLDGAPRTLRLRGLAARAVQHEMDHLQGVLIVDRMTQLKRLALSGRLKRLRRRTREALAPAAG